MNWDYFMVWLASRVKWRKKGMRHHPMNECLNCEKALVEDQFFCSHCGQKVHNSKLTIWSLIGEFFAGIFNLDNGVYRSLLNLPRPGYLSKQFMSGKRKRYLNPIRLFLVALIIHITVITNLIPLNEVNKASAKNIESSGQQTLKSEYEAIKDSLTSSFPGCDVDSIGNIIFASATSADSLVINNQSSDGNSIINISNWSNKYVFSWSDIYDMDIDDFLVRYNAQSYWEKIGMTQLLRTMRDPSGAIRFGIGNLIWSVLSTIIIMGFFMKLLYIRRKRYYVEHLIVLFNIHSFAFLLASLGLFIGFNVDGLGNSIDDYAYLIIALFFFLSIKFYYQQGWIKTLFKFALIGLMYLSLLIFMIVLVTIISLFFFK